MSRQDVTAAIEAAAAGAQATVAAPQPAPPPYPQHIAEFLSQQQQQQGGPGCAAVREAPSWQEGVGPTARLHKGVTLLCLQ